MQNTMQNQVALVGRILLGIFFIMSGFEKITGFSGTVGYIASVGLPLPQIGAVIAILVELGGGLMLVFGFQTRWAAYALAVFALASGFLFHNFWAAPDADKTGQFVNFWKNVTIAGGMLMAAAFGPGSISVDARRNA
ncbi:MAG: DoxX family protein [Caldimonas sp.]